MVAPGNAHYRAGQRFILKPLTLFARSSKARQRKSPPRRHHHQNLHFGAAES